MKTIKRSLRILVVAALASFAPAAFAASSQFPVPSPEPRVPAERVQAQSAEQAEGIEGAARWLPFLGCWRPADERAPEQGVLVCVVPAGANSARMMTMAGEQSVIDETFVADGVRRPVVEPGCRGTRTSDWSRRGRLLSAADLACEGQPARNVSGLSFIALGGDWVDIQAVTTGGREIVRVRRYRRTGELPPDASLLAPQVTARAAQSLDAARLTPFILDDVIEVSGKVSSGALEAAIVETQAIFPLNSRTLIALDDAGVAANVIDLMVAQTFPKQFQVKRRGGGSSSGSWAGYGGVGWDWFGFDPYYSYYAPVGYGYWNRFGDYYYGPGQGVIIVPGDGGSAAPSGEHGRVINGGGYTQVSPRDPVVTGNAGTRGRSTGDGVSGASGGSSSGGFSGDSGGVSSGGYSSGGGGGDSGRSAVPR